MFRRLSKEGYIDYTPRHGAELTAKGLEVALEIIRHHRLLEAYFVQRLGMDWAQAHREAEILEHFISEELENLIDQALGHPEEDPHGAPIPGRDGKMAERELVPLSEAAPGARYVVRRVRAESPELLDYLKQVNLVPGAELELTAVGPFDGPVSLKTGDAERHVGHLVASAVQVEAVGASPPSPKNSKGSE
jgi:DtxR family Mn-dependent transcriptional regulator